VEALIQMVEALIQMVEALIQMVEALIQMVEALIQMAEAANLQEEHQRCWQFVVGVEVVSLQEEQ